MAFIAALKPILTGFLLANGLGFALMTGLGLVPRLSRSLAFAVRRRIQEVRVLIHQIAKFSIRYDHRIQQLRIIDIIMFHVTECEKFPIVQQVSENGDFVSMYAILFTNQRVHGDNCLNQILKVVHSLYVILSCESTWQRIIRHMLGQLSSLLDVFTH